MSIAKTDVFGYSTAKRAGKIEVVTSELLETQRHLSLAYTPGVAKVVLAVADHVDKIDAMAILIDGPDNRLGGIT
jgi:malic enzyme